MDEVRRDRVGAALVVTIDRPPRRNAVDGPTAQALRAAYDDFERDDSARVLVLTGAGGTFCAGADLTAIETLVPRVGSPEGPMGITRLTPGKPTIAAIEGWAVAGGLELALTADLRICAPDARFGLLERRWGVPLVDGGTWRLPQVVGLGRALDLVLTGRVVEAAEAHAIGLVTEIADRPLDRALALAEQLAAFPQETMLADRASVYAGLGQPQQAALAMEMLAAAGTLEAAAQGAARFAAGAGRGGTAPGEPAVS